MVQEFSLNSANPDYASMGYGSKAIELLNDYFEGKFTGFKWKW